MKKKLLPPERIPIDYTRLKPNYLHMIKKVSSVGEVISGP